MELADDTQLGFGFGWRGRGRRVETLELFVMTLATWAALGSFFVTFCHFFLC
ncbi:MAG: hypothetical protein ETSY1_25335 [Candidatus Entotheonella factor]|uniref:Uncharacterized protein n=1 Tax=Entotheonella factor TaxID=1429438 RepID=W4LFT1_ENTF1|nr:MAG: hypothetical protein ETSY1_25335 [Candidatus Entotheonella factor]